MAAKRKMPPGANIPEAARNTVAVKLRLSPEDAEALRGIARTAGVPTSRIVGQWVRQYMHLYGLPRQSSRD